VVDEVVALGERVDGDLVAAFAGHGLALRAGDGAALAQASSDFERLGAFLYAAEAMAAAARRFRQADEADGARRASARGAALQRQCEGVLTPALGWLEQPELSKREREVATLAAQGLSNAEIASQLMLSVRTIENHLHKVYRKLGVARREELASVLGPE
jgi:DNA-binding NarL/FixJ family response regulator